MSSSHGAYSLVEVADGAPKSRKSRNALRDSEPVALTPCVFRFNFGDGNGVRSIEHPGFQCSGCGSWLPAPMEPGYQVCTCPDCFAVHGLKTL